MTKSFLGRGFSHPLATDAAGGIKLSQYEDNIEECVQIILGTAPGERIYRPLFGCRIHDMIFAPNDAHTRNLVAFYAREALLKWEPRIREIEVEAKHDTGKPSTIELHISYAVRATNTTYNLVYPFYLRREEDL